MTKRKEKVGLAKAQALLDGTWVAYMPPKQRVKILKKVVTALTELESRVPPHKRLPVEQAREAAQAAYTHAKEGKHD